jgi:TIR domain
MSRKRNFAPTEVFLSHSSRNRVFTSRLAKTLSAHGVRSFLSAHSIRGAQQWHDEIGAALKRCDWFIVILSPQSVRSRWVKYELLYALRASRFQDRIIPVLYKRCDADSLSFTLSSIEWVDFRRDFHEGCRQLLRIWTLDYQP